MAEIIAFPLPAQAAGDAEVDLLTAVDAAIRDLRDIAAACLERQVRERADECRAMLERAFHASVA
jgi:hypothetical protein